MKILFIVGSIVLPIAMYLLQKKWTWFHKMLDGMAIFSALLFGNILSLSIYEVIQNKSVFMTNIHAILLDPFFLSSGAYLGVYLLYRLLHLMWNKSGSTI